jgi:hypothetical protein
MKKAFTLFVFIIALTFSHAQIITPNDSVSTSAQNTDMVFYNLATAQKTTASNTDWHLAVTVRPTQFPNAPLGGTSIRLNESNGVHAYIAPSADSTTYNTLDTTNWQTWRMLHDADTTIDEGALNSTRRHSGPNYFFDFGWGWYNSSSHNVVGDSVFIIALPNNQFKKIIINLIWDTAFVIKYSNIDNSSPQTIYISKHNYQGKEFVYLNLLDNTVKDKEPLSSTWDLLFLKYAATDVTADSVTPKVGVWLNSGNTAARCSGVDLNLNSASSAYKNALNSIGWNWYYFNSGSNAYAVYDSLDYFVHTIGGTDYKIIFTGFGGTTTGVVSFYKQAITTGIKNIYVDENAVTVFPNPGSNHISIRSSQYKFSVMKIADLNGREVMSTRFPDMELSELDISSLTNGIYFITLVSNETSVTKKIIVAR